MNFDNDDLLDLEKYLDQNSIPKNKVCIVGSAVLSILGIRENDDIDIVIHSSLDINLDSHTFINVAKSPWSKLYSDDELIEDSNYHFTYAGFKFVIPELLYHRKIWHNRQKDILDIYELEEYANMQNDWNWELIQKKLPIKSSMKVLFIKIRKQLTFFRNYLNNYFSFSYLIHRDCHQMISPNLLISKQIVNGEFNRFDIIVRYLAIHSYINKDDTGVNLYQRMQDKRGATEFSRPMKEFQKLIRSFNKYGYDNTFPILVNDDLHIVDGAHRLACALYFNIPFISIKVNSKLDYSVYSINWFKENSFSSSETSFLCDQKNTLFIEKNLYFEVILWPPIVEYFDEVEGSIRKEFTILDSNSYFDVKNFDDFVRNVYCIDDIKTWKVDLKIKAFANFKKHIRILKILINDPHYRMKANGKCISKKVEKLKSDIRNKYMTKGPEYFHDIIIHIGDSYEHTKYTSSLKIKM